MRGPRETSRRAFITTAATAGAGVILGGCAADQSLRRPAEASQAPGAEAGVSPAEDLMREHGVLRRILLVYEEAARRLDAAWDLLKHYCRRGTFEDRLGEFNAVIGPGLPAESFVANEASLLLKLLAFNLAGMIRGELEDSSGSGWDLKRVQQTVLKAGARVVEHGHRIFVDVAKAAGVLWGRLLDRIKRWWRPSGVSRVGRGGHAEAGDEVWGRVKPRPRPWVSPPSHAHLCLVLRE